MKLTISKPGKNKEELLTSLEKLKESYKDQISDNSIEIKNITDGYKIRAEKRMILKFWVEAEIIARDGEYEITWETNAPKGKVEGSIKKIEGFLLDL